MILYFDFLKATTRKKIMDQINELSLKDQAIHKLNTILINVNDENLVIAFLLPYQYLKINHR